MKNKLKIEEVRDIFCEETLSSFEKVSVKGGYVNYDECLCQPADCACSAQDNTCQVIIAKPLP